MTFASPSLPARIHRRLLVVETAPHSATMADVAHLLRAHCVPTDTAVRALDRAEQLGLTAPSVWAWVLDEDGIEVATALVASAAEGTTVDRVWRTAS